MAKPRLVPAHHTHARKGVTGEVQQHRVLESVGEVLVDDGLALCLGPDYYESAHSHGVPYSRIFGVSTHELFSSLSDQHGFTGRRSPTADVVLWTRRGAFIVEVTGGLQREPSERPRADGYATRLRAKEALCERFGAPIHFIDFEVGEIDELVDSIFELLRVVERRLGVRLPRSRIRETTLAASLRDHPRVSAFYCTYGETQRVLVERRITKVSLYKTACAEERRLPSNPHLIYPQHWLSWRHFFARARGIDPATITDERFDIEAARTHVIGLRLGSQVAYRRHFRSGRADPRLVAWPPQYYSDFAQRGGWPWFLGLPVANPPPGSLSQIEVAARLGVSTSRVSNLAGAEPSLSPVFERPYASRGESRLFYDPADVDRFQAATRKFSEEELRDHCATRCIANVAEYLRFYAEECSAAGWSRMPVNPISYYGDDFQRRGGWNLILAPVPMPELPWDAVTIEELCRLCGVTKSAVSQWQTPKGGGLTAHHRRKGYTARDRPTVWFRLSAVLVFLSSRTRRSTRHEAMIDSVQRRLQRLKFE